ncbi:hypothetical protein [Phenylobacterium zucineum]|uniref:hypothetical protein n=1 Tax=Phenylobacterium zucineum TaxID=284016 RepID=UPI00030934D7|nr:hypothetical protein [Phenylobacterium zucineum]
METEDVEQEIEDAADALGVVAPGLGSGKGKAYEAWVLFEIAARLLGLGYPVEAHAPDGQPVSTFRLRGSPSGMSAASFGPTSDKPSHFRVEGQRTVLEIHAGVQMLGVSGTPHEVDVSVLPATAGEQLRAAGGGAYLGRLHHCLELKAYDAEYKLSQGMPRALLGVALDLDPAWAIPQVGYITHGGAVRVHTRAQRIRYALLTSTDLYDHSRTLLEHHGVLAGEQVLPRLDEGPIDLIVQELIEILGPPPPPPSYARPLRPLSRRLKLSTP